MTPTRKRRLIITCLILLGAGTATAIALSAFNQNLMFFISPSEVAAGDYPQGRNFRVGGLVVAGSVQREDGELEVMFDVTDGAHTVPVSFSGILPDLFREGQGIIAEGKLSAAGVFQADNVLAKHDENYMPPEVAEALRKAGHPDAPSTGEVTPTSAGG